MPRLYRREETAEQRSPQVREGVAAGSQAERLPEDGAGPRLLGGPGSEGRGPLPTQEADYVEQVDAQRVAQLAEALGMHPDFVRDVSHRGMMAVIDRVEETDETGAKGKLLRVIQEFGTWLERRVQTGQRPSSDEFQQAAVAAAEQMDVEPSIAWTAVRAVMGKYMRMSEILGGDDGQTTQI